MVLHSTRRKWKLAIGPAREHWLDQMCSISKHMSFCMLEPQSGPCESLVMDVLSLQHQQGQWLKVHLLLIFFPLFVNITSTYVDGAANIAWVQQNPQATLLSKTSDVAALYNPLLTQLLQVLQKYAPVEANSKASQEMVALKTQLAKREEQLAFGDEPPSKTTTPDARTLSTAR